MQYRDDMETYFTNDAFTDLLKKYYSSNQIFSLFSSDFKDNYIEDIYNSYSSFIGKPVKYIISQCLSTWKTWDSYNLHFHLLSLLYNLEEFTPLTLDIMNISMMQIHSNPNKRLTTEKVIDKYNSIIKSSNSDVIIQYMGSMKSINQKKVKQNFYSSYPTLHV